MTFSQEKMTVDEYSNQFALIAADANISDKEQVHYYQRGLDPKVMDKIHDKKVPPKDTIQDWINTACDIDRCMREERTLYITGTSFTCRTTEFNVQKDVKLSMERKTLNLDDTLIKMLTCMSLNCKKRKK